MEANNLVVVAAVEVVAAGSARSDEQYPSWVAASSALLSEYSEVEGIVTRMVANVISLGVG